MKSYLSALFVGIAIGTVACGNSLTGPSLNPNPNPLQFQFRDAPDTSVHRLYDVAGNSTTAMTAQLLKVSPAPGSLITSSASTQTPSGESCLRNDCFHYVMVLCMEPTANSNNGYLSVATFNSFWSADGSQPLDKGHVGGSFAAVQRGSCTTISIDDPHLIITFRSGTRYLLMWAHYGQTAGTIDGWGFNWPNAPLGGATSWDLGYHEQ